MSSLPTEILGKVNQWKRCGYEPHLVRIFIDKEYQFVVRAISREEFSVLVENNNPAEFYPAPPMEGVSHPSPIIEIAGQDHRQDLIRAALLWPDHLDPDLPASIDAHLFNNIAGVSGWASEDALVRGLIEARAYVCTLQGFLESRICKAFPHMSTDDLSKMNFQQFIKLVALSEAITGVDIDLRPWLAPDEYQRELDKISGRQKRMRRAQMSSQFRSIRGNPKAQGELLQQYLLQEAELRGVDLTNRDTKPDFQRERDAILSI